jgi:hypothetical protein
MNILEALARQHIKPTIYEGREYGTDGQLTMHDDIFKMQCQELNLAADIIDDLTSEPVTSRDDYLHYFRTRQ